MVIKVWGTTMAFRMTRMEIKADIRIELVVMVGVTMEISMSEETAMDVDTACVTTF